MFTYYDILEIRPDATITEIKLAYKKAIHKYHPDLNKEKDTSEKFKIVIKAYKTLSDPVKRLEYDKNTKFKSEKNPNTNIFNKNNNIKNKSYEEKEKKNIKFIFSEIFNKQNIENFLFNIKKVRADLRKKKFIEREKAKLESNIKINFYEDMNSTELVARLRTSNNAFVRANMAKLIGQKRDKNYVFELVKSLSDNASVVRKEAAAALGIIKDYRALNFLVNSIHDYENDVRCEVAKSLRNFEDTRAVSALLKMLTDINDEVVAEAVYSLGVIGDSDIAMEIRKLYKHDSIKVKRAALEVVKVLK